MIGFLTVFCSHVLFGVSVGKDGVCLAEFRPQHDSRSFSNADSPPQIVGVFAPSHPHQTGYCSLDMFLPLYVTYRLGRCNHYSANQLLSLLNLDMDICYSPPHLSVSIGLYPTMNWCPDIRADVTQDWRRSCATQ